MSNQVITAPERHAPEVPSATPVAPIYTPGDWYFQRSSDGKVFSTRRIALVPITDPEFQKWMTDVPGRMPTPWPKDGDGEETIAALQAQLSKAGDYHASLEHYAGSLRWMAQSRPVPVAVSGHTYAFQADDASKNKIANAIMLAREFETASGQPWPGVAWKTSDGFTEDAIQLDDLVMVGLALGAAESALFAKEAEVDVKIGSGEIHDKAGVEAAFAA